MGVEEGVCFRVRCKKGLRNGENKVHTTKCYFSHATNPIQASSLHVLCNTLLKNVFGILRTITKIDFSILCGKTSHLSNYVLFPVSPDAKIQTIPHFSAISCNSVRLMESKDLGGKCSSLLQNQKIGLNSRALNSSQLLYSINAYVQPSKACRSRQHRSRQYPTYVYTYVYLLPP